MSGEAPDIREQEDCPGGDICLWACDQHINARGGSAVEALPMTLEYTTDDADWQEVTP